MPMIYIVRGLEDGNMKPVDSDKSDFITIAGIKIIEISTENKFKQVQMKNGQTTTLAKRDLAYYFISGKMTDRRRILTSIKSRSLLVLDYDNNDKDNLLTLETIQSAVNSNLAEYSYYLFPSTSYTEQQPKFRLIVDAERGMTRAEYVATVKDLAQLIGLPFDNASVQWAQMMGLPTTDNIQRFKELATIQHSKAFPISEVSEVDTNKERSLNIGDSFTYTTGYKGKVVLLLEEVIQGIGEGSRNVFFTKAFGTLITAQMQADLAIRLCIEWNDNYCSPPLTHTELIGIFNSIHDRERKKVNHD